jgi:hypothetical protein
MHIPVALLQLCGLPVLAVMATDQRDWLGGCFGYQEQKPVVNMLIAS